MRILGIDPGSSRIGYGLIEKGAGQKLALLDYGVIEISPRLPKEKMLAVGRRMKELVSSMQPDIAAVETLYFSKNQKTAIEVAGARGVILYVLQDEGVEIVEYGPGEIKAAVAGYGNADKQAVAKMVKMILNITELVGHDDASDALAVAITAAGHLKIAS